MASPTTGLSEATLRRRQRWLWWNARDRERWNSKRSKVKSERRKWIVRVTPKNATQVKRLQALNSLGGPKCGQCGYDSDIRALQIDHIEGGQGRKDRAQFKNNAYNFYRHVIQEGRAKFQVLCANCNIIKKIAMREFGKQTEL